MYCNLDESCVILLSRYFEEWSRMQGRRQKHF